MESKVKGDCCILYAYLTQQSTTQMSTLIIPGKSLASTPYVGMKQQNRYNQN